MGDCTLSVSNMISILELKQKYIDQLTEKELKPSNLRLFCLGKELKDDLFIYSYDIVDEVTVQAMIKRN